MKKNMKFISYTDFSLKHISDVRLSIVLKKMLLKALKETNVFLIKTFINKVIIDYKDGLVSLESFSIIITDFIFGLTSKMIIADKIMEITTIEDVNVILNDVFSKTPLLENVSNPFEVGRK